MQKGVPRSLERVFWMNHACRDFRLVPPEIGHTDRS